MQFVDEGPCSDAAGDDWSDRRRRITAVLEIDGVIAEYPSRPSVELARTRLP